MGSIGSSHQSGSASAEIDDSESSNQSGSQSAEIRDSEPLHQSGSASAELVVLATFLAFITLLFVALGRFGASNEEVQAAARAGSQAAVIQAAASSAQSAGQDAALETVSDKGLTCQGANVVVDTSNFHPGGWVAVQMKCTVSMATLTLPGIPGSRTLSATVVSPIEPYRPIAP